MHLLEGLQFKALFRQITIQNNYICKSGIQSNANTDGDYYLYISTTYISIKQLINLNEILALPV